MQLDDLLAQILERIESGETPSPDEYLDRYPQLADELVEFFRNQAWIARAHADPLAPPNAHSVWDTASLHDATQRAVSLVGCHVGPYQLTQQLARGGMGTVYRAWHNDLQRQVAVKLISSGILASPEEIARFRLEAEAAAQLEHPNIVSIYEVGSWRQQTYFSMTLVDGDSLQSWVHAERRDFEQVALVVRDIARAVDYAHGRSVIHRDLKPANILVAADGTPMLTDFGLAKWHRDDANLTKTGQILGTPEYMSPEQAAGSNHIGPASDIYSLGAVLYALLTGQSPHAGDSTAEILTNVLTNDPIAPRDINRHVPIDLQRICLKCLNDQASDRYASAQQLADDLDRFMQGERISVGRSSLLHSIARTLGRDQYHKHFRNWGTALILMGFTIFAAHVAMFVFVRQGRDQWACYWIPRGTMAVVLLAIVFYYRNGALRARSPAERPVWSIWLGYLVSLGTMNVIQMLRSDSQLELFPIASSLAAFGFIAMGGHVWGGCYVLGAAFALNSLVSVFLDDGAILTFGLSWLVSLAVLAHRYRRPAAEQSSR